jgi:glycosyltransferase involved in cell wall biosynthesis
MRVLVAHNAYKYVGGEDTVFRNETALLRAAGHQVHEYWDDNHRIEEMNFIRLGAGTIWSNSSRKKLRATIEEFRPEIVHFHNTFPLISPSAYYACHEAGIPVVQTLHNYRFLCPGALLYRDGRVCEDCLPKRLKWPGVLHGCYRNSRSATTTVTAMLAVHHLLGTWRERVNQYIALSEFSRRKFIEGGLPSERIAVKPNFVSVDPGIREGLGDYALFVGRLAAEKGPRLLLHAWKLGKFSFPLRLIGDGPLRGDLEREREELGLCSIVFNGWVAQSAVTEIMKCARFLVVASQTYENFPLAIAEAYACGVAVIAPQHGAMAEIVQDGVTGLRFQPGSAQDLAAKLEWAFSHPAALEEMGRAARAEYEAKYTGERNYQILMRIYQQASLATA